MQDGYIFSDTIARNIVPKDVEIDRQRLEYAVRMANAHDTVMALPLKYETFIGDEGQGLSAGQKQRLLIARAVYKDVPFVFLDEATNSLDAKNEKAITENLQSFYKGKTVIIIAHRMSTVMNADRIIVMDAGKIVETGLIITIWLKISWILAEKLIFVADSQFFLQGLSNYFTILISAFF